MRTRHRKWPKKILATLPIIGMIVLVLGIAIGATIIDSRNQYQRGLNINAQI